MQLYISNQKRLWSLWNQIEPLDPNPSRRLIFLLCTSKIGTNWWHFFAFALQQTFGTFNKTMQFCSLIYGQITKLCGDLIVDVMVVSYPSNYIINKCFSKVIKKSLFVTYKATSQNYPITNIWQNVNRRLCAFLLHVIALIKSVSEFSD